MKCKLRALPKSRSETVRDDIRTFFEERKPYDFLQLCYYQVGRDKPARLIIRLSNLFNFWLNLFK